MENDVFRDLPSPWKFLFWLAVWSGTAYLFDGPFAALGAGLVIVALAIADLLATLRKAAEPPRLGHYDENGDYIPAGINAPLEGFGPDLALSEPPHVNRESVRPLPKQKQDWASRKTKIEILLFLILVLALVFLWINRTMGHR